MPTSEQLSVLAHEWDRLMNACDARKEASTYAFAQIIAAYSESHRYYHNLNHIVSMLGILTWDLRYPYAECMDYRALELAVWYHDVVYDPRSSENESRSADVARNSLGDVGLTKDYGNRVCELILMTKDHDAPSNDLIALLFIDMDLSILAASRQRYAKYATDIRREYAWVAGRDFYQGRRKVLQRF